jgi:hypothetical protein
MAQNYMAQFGQNNYMMAQNMMRQSQSAQNYPQNLNGYSPQNSQGNGAQGRR